MLRSHTVAAHTAAAFLAVVALSGVASAASIAIGDSNFETIFQHNTATPVTTSAIAASTSGTFNNSAFVNGGVVPQPFNVDIPDWTVVTGTGGAEKLGSLSPSDSTNMGYIGMFIAGGSTIGQTLGTNFASSTIYTLSVTVIRRTDQPNVETVAGSGTTAFPLDFGGSVLAGGIPLVPIAPATYSIPAAGTSTSYSISFDSSSLANAARSGPLSIQFSVDSGQANIDDVTLTAVPEPAGLSLLGLGGLAMVVRRRVTSH